MRPDQREDLRQRYGYRCGYCGVTETDVGSELTVGHYRPRSQGADDQPDNWVYSCFTCNTYKSDVWSPDSPERVLHPLRDDIAAHIAPQPDGALLGLTETGRFHIQQLQLNRPALVAHRLAHMRQADLGLALDELLNRQELLRRRVQELEQAVADAERRLTSL